MNQHPFTATLAHQHRADLMAAAQHARECRRAKGTRSLRWRPRRAPLTPRRPATPLVHVADAV
jgi:hypothetical protein